MGRQKHILPPPIYMTIGVRHEMQKWQTISELAAITGAQITNSPENRQQFLTTAARFYKA